MSSCLNALSAVTWEDICKPLIGHRVSEAQKTWITKGLGVCLCLLVLVYGAAGVGFAFVAQNLGGTVLQAAMSFTGAASGPLLGLFLLGGVFPWANWAGCVVGGILGLAFPLWISVGAYNLPSSGYTLEFPTENCPVANVSMATTVAPVTTTVEELSGIEVLYTVSYLWYPSIGTATAVVVGLIISLVTRPFIPEHDIDPKYLIPFFDRLLCFLPEKWRYPCRCGYEFKDPEDIQHEENDQEIIIEANPDSEKASTQVSPAMIYPVTQNLSKTNGVLTLSYKPRDEQDFCYQNHAYNNDVSKSVPEPYLRPVKGSETQPWSIRGS